MKTLNVVIQDPVTLREVKHIHVSANRISHDEHGQDWFDLMDGRKAEVITVEQVSQEEMDATLNYFRRYGTERE
tara:strand:+ start:1113 stop:1334 length:222 start_codon:yes stop_codon:yes gene_type:complete